MRVHTILPLLALIAGGAVAADPNSALIQKIESRIGTGQVDSIIKSPYAELYEIRTKREILYSDKEGKYLVAGKVIEVASGKDLTEERLNEINRIDFKTLPLEMAIKYTKGTGKRVFAVFEDPNCGYCKKFRNTIHALDNVTVYTFQYNILSDASKAKSRDIWCSPDRAKAWDDWMLNHKEPVAAAATCTAPHEQVLEFGKKYRISGTPAVIFTDGTRIPGAVDVKVMEERLSKIAG